LVWIAGIKPATYALESRVYQYFGNDFGNKAVVFPQSFVIPIDLAAQNIPHHKPPKFLMGKQIKHLGFGSSF
jgi:hypothetical protein